MKSFITSGPGLTTVEIVHENMLVLMLYFVNYFNICYMHKAECDGSVTFSMPSCL